MHGSVSTRDGRSQEMCEPTDVWLDGPPAKVVSTQPYEPTIPLLSVLSTEGEACSIRHRQECP